MDMINLNAEHAVPAPSWLEADCDDDALRHISEAVSRVNEAVLRAVHTGVSVELVRTSRCHDERGNWGDQMTPTIRKDGYLRV